jgi:uracil-DNA glycosylase family 4
MSKRDLMERIVTDIEACHRCELWKNRGNAVPGEGNLDAAIMFIGEAPGYWENVKGRPFIGAAGKLLDETLGGIGLSRNDVYIANILKDRPPENRDPKPEEIQACTPYLDRQIEIIKPKIIVTLGRHSTAYILAKAGIEAVGVTLARGKVYEAELLGLKVLVIPTYHPAAALYYPKYKDMLEKDFQVIKGELEKLGLI